MPRLPGLVLAGLLLGSALPAAAADAPGSAGSGGIYTCVDAKGRKLTADRPIVECIDREQRQITPAGTVVRRIGPSLTADEQAAEEEKTRRAAEERSRDQEERRRHRALLGRYPDQAAHDNERTAALQTNAEVIDAANRRMAELHKQREKLDAELEFYKGDIRKAPAKLRRQVEDVDRQLDVQKRFIADQESERKRITARYDIELAQLKVLWAQRPPASRPATAASSTR